MSEVSEDRNAYLALDQGGHASRALILDGSGRVLARGLRQVGELRPRRGWVEQDPEELVTSLAEAAAEAVACLARPMPRLRAGLATQRSSVVCWNLRTGEPLSAVLSWQDRRAHRWLSGYRDEARRIHERTGLQLTAHYGVSKLRWCLEHLPAVREAVRAGVACCGPLASFLAFRLLRERPRVADPANAARTLLWNLAGLDWDDELLETFGVPREVLPETVPTRHGFGTLELEGIAVPLEILTGDQSAALFAHGRPDRDTAYLNVGTGAFVQRSSSCLPADLGGLLASVVYRDARRTVYVAEGSVNGAGSAINLVAGELGLTDHRERLHRWLAEAEEPPLFLNGVSGLGSPFWVADFRSRFVGSGAPWERLVAVVESIVFLVRVNLRELERHGGPFRRVLATGGIAGYDGLCQRLADLSGVPVERPEEHEATARGTAFLLAGLPSRWPAATGLGFEPREDPKLSERFRRWEARLRRVVGS